MRDLLLPPLVSRDSRRRFAGTFALLATASLALVSGLPAQQQTAMLSAKQLKRMSVEELLQQEVLSVSRRPESLGKAAGNIFYIDGDSSRFVGASTLPELLRMAPSLYVAQADSYTWGVNARGFMRSRGASNKMLVLIDGRTAYSPLFSNVFWDSTDVFLPDLESIEVISGPGGSNWGSNAVNGVINIRSKSAHETLGGLLQMSGGTDGSQFAARQGFRLGETGAMRVYAKRTDREPTLSATGTEDDFDEWHATQAGLRADWGAASTGKFTVQGDWLAGRYAAGAGLPQIRNDNGNLLARWDRATSADSQLWVRAYYDYVMRNTRNLLTETSETVDVEFQHAKQFGGGQQLLWGGNYRQIYDQADDTVGFALLPAHVTLTLASVFAQHEVGWAQDTFRLTTGLRLERNDYTGWEYQPTIRLAWQQPEHTAWVAVARATRTPSRLEKDFYAPATPPHTIVNGGPDFVSEILLSYEAGWRGQLAPGLALTATAYYHDYDELRTVERTVPLVQANKAQGRSYGLELFMDYDINPRWRLRAGGFVMEQETSLEAGSLDGDGGLGESSFPGYQAFLRSNFRLTSKMDLWLSLRRIGEVPTVENGGGTVPAYTELNARLGWQMRPNLELALIGRNLLDHSHPEIGGMLVRREIRRSVALSLRWEF